MDKKPEMITETQDTNVSSYDKPTYNHVVEKFRYMVERPDEERLDFLNEERWVGYDVAEEILTELKGLLYFPKRLRMPNLLLIGEANNGKTNIINRFYKLHGSPHDENERLVMPVILAHAPASSNEKDMYIAILESMNMPYQSKNSISALSYQVIHLFKEYEVRMLIIDEFHSMFDGTPRQQRQIMNGLKTLCNQLQMPIVGVGTESAERALLTDPQHRSRFGVTKLPLWKLDKNFQKLLFRIEGVLPLKNPSNLKQPQLASLVHSISNGNLGNVHRLLAVCAKDAIISGTEQITEDMLLKNRDVRLTQGLG